MKRHASAADHAKEAAQAHTNLNVFAAIITLMEGGHLSNSGSVYSAERRISVICRAQIQVELKNYDRAIAAIEGKK